MKNNFSFKPHKYRTLFLGILSMFGLLTACERIEKTSEFSEAIGDSKAISEQEIQKIFNSKANLESVLVSDGIYLSVPENYYYQTAVIDSEDFDPDINFGEIDLSKKDSYSIVELKNALFLDNELYTEHVNIIKDDNPNLLKIEDLKEEFTNEKLLFEDENSAVYSDDKTYTTVHFQYDQKTKSYLIYYGNISWTKEFPLDEKLDLAFYFLRNAKNLLSENFTKQEFSWKDYVENSPKIEINLMRNLFGNMEKEMKVFLDEGKSTSPKYDEYSFFELYRLKPNQETALYEYINGLNNRSDYSDGEKKWQEELFYSTLEASSNTKYNLITKGNSTVIEISRFDNDNKFSDKRFAVFCVINYQKKFFVLKNVKQLNEKEVNLYVKIFNYFANNYSLNVPEKK